VVFTEESSPHQYVKLIANGEVDEILLDAIGDYVRRQKKRLGLYVPRHIVTGEKPPGTILGSGLDENEDE